MLAQDDQLRVGLVDIPVAPFEGEGFDGVPGVEQDAPAPDCVTVNVCPAMVIVPVRELVLVLAETE